MEWVAHLCRERKAFRPGSAHPSITRIHIRENSSIHNQETPNQILTADGHMRPTGLGRSVGAWEFRRHPSSSVVIRRHPSSSVTFTR